MSEATKDSKFCKDCKWSGMNEVLYQENYFCTHPKLTPEQQYDYVIGPVPIDYSSCYGLRASGECGPEGKYWESPIKWATGAGNVYANNHVYVSTNHVNSAVYGTVVNVHSESVSESVKFEDLYWEDAPKPKVSWWNWIRGKAD